MYTLFFVVARKINFDDPQVLNIVRLAYVAVQAIVLGTYYYTSMKVCSAAAVCGYETVLMTLPCISLRMTDQAEE